MKICIDYGHCIVNPVGARGCGYLEEVINREVGRKVTEKLKALGHEVHEIYLDDASSQRAELNWRVNTINTIKPDISISIHHNAFNGQAYGTEIFTKGGIKLTEAVRIMDEFKGLGFTIRGVKDTGSGLALVDSVWCQKAMLVECCFIDNEGDMKKYDAEKFATAIVNGIIGQITASPKPTAPTPTAKVTYRVRKSWSDTKTQKGAFTVLENAIKCAKENVGYKVYDEKGNQVYPKPSSKKYLNLNKHMEKWAVYPTDKAPISANKVGYLSPSQFGGLSYEILANPQTDVYTIQTQTFGKVNIYAPRDNDSSITDKPLF